MKNYRKLQDFNIRVSLLFALIIVFSAFSTWAQTCEKTAMKNKEKPLVNKLADLVWNGELDKIKTLVEENSELVNQRLKNEETMLTLAAWKGNYDVAEYLVKMKADVNLKNDWQNTALHNAAQKGFNDIIKLLLINGADINDKGTSGNTALFFATGNEHEKTVKLLLQAGANVDAANNNDQTPLLRASWNGNPEIIRMLVEKGADVNVKGSNGNNIMYNLAYGGFYEAVQLIMENGGEVNKADDEGRIPLHAAVINKKPEIVSLLLSKTKDVNIKEKCLGNTPLHIAAINGDLKSTEFLIKSGAKADILNYSKKTPVDYAVKYGYADIVTYYAKNSMANKEAILLAQENKTAGLVKVNNGEAKVIYCGHSGWAVQTEKHLLIFDYWSRNKSGHPGLANGSICPNEIRDKDVIVFVSHDHSDHYDTCIYKWANVVKNITYVYGFKPEESEIYNKNGYNGPKYVYVEDHKTKQVGTINITTLKSNDSGQGFLVEADGITIYHPGDHALFTSEDEPDFKKEVDFIAGRTQHVDLAFLPVTGCPSRWKKEFIVQGFFYSIDKLNPAEVFPMHAFQREYSMKEFAELAEKKLIENQIVCTENTGDSFSYTKDMVAAK